MGRRYEQTFFQTQHIDGQQTHEKMLNITHYQRNANQNYNEISLHTCQNGSNQQHKKQQVVVRMQMKRNPLALLVGMQTGAATLENSVEVPQKINSRTTLGSSNGSEYLPTEYKNTNSKVYNAPLCLWHFIYNNQIIVQMYIN